MCTIIWCFSPSECRAGEHWEDRPGAGWEGGWGNRGDARLTPTYTPGRQAIELRLCSPSPPQTQREAKPDTPAAADKGINIYSSVGLDRGDLDFTDQLWVKMRSSLYCCCCCCFVSILLFTIMSHRFICVKCILIQSGYYHNHWHVTLRVMLIVVFFPFRSPVFLFELTVDLSVMAVLIFRYILIPGYNRLSEDGHLCCQTWSDQTMGEFIYLRSNPWIVKFHPDGIPVRLLSISYDVTISGTGNGRQHMQLLKCRKLECWKCWKAVHSIYTGEDGYCSTDSQNS